MILKTASFQHTSCNRKLSPVGKEKYNGPARDKFPFRPIALGPFCSSTYASIAATCDDACPFKRDEQGNTGGCFADAGRASFEVRRLDAHAHESDSSGFEVILDEVSAIDSAWINGIPQDGARGGRDLRLHVAGDAPTIGSAIMLGEAAARWRKRGGGTVWTYTHSWRHIDRIAWGPKVSVLASIERRDEAREARARGYAPAIVVPDFPNGAKAFSLDDKVKAIPCPAETVGTTCVECRLCLDVDLLSIGRGIAFRAHGRDTSKALVKLESRQLQLEAVH